MGGQVPAISEQSRPAELTDDIGAVITEQVSDSQSGDPIATFLENHGYQLVPDHEGRLVTAAEAVQNCPPFRELVMVMGERALHLAAPRHQETEQEADEPEIDQEESETVDKDGKELQFEKEVKVNGPQEKNDSDDKPLVKKEQPVEVALEKPSEKTFTDQVTDSINNPAAKQIINPPESRATEMNNRNLEKPPIDTELKPATAEPARSVEAPASAVQAKQPSRQSEKAISVQNNTAESIVIEHDEFALPADSERIEHQEIVLDTDARQARPETLTEATQTEEENVEYEFQIPDEENIDRDENPLIENPDIEFVMEPEEKENTIYDFAEDFPIPQWDEEQPLFVLPEEEHEILSTKLSVPVEEFEATINLVAERIEELDDEQTEEVYQILDQIVEAPKKLAVSDEGEVINQKEVRQELENLFADLFDRLGIEYSPELLSAFATLTLNNQLDEVLGVKEGDELVYEIPTERGTHEFITKLLISFAKLKKALLHAYLIGKSAVHHALKPDLNLQPV
ncbi:MAG TPA: hypothetical protein VI336_02745 [Candidatus Saccharimonadales bacterium]|nr:hypothetical protein [Candidatus Saccharimonadales bacterium]